MYSFEKDADTHENASKSAQTTTFSSILKATLQE
jgi:hypothetical protein